MISSIPESGSPIPAEHLAEAGVWIARLHGDDRSAELESGFRSWLAAHPMNTRAFELATEVWEDSHNLRRVIPFAHEMPARAPRAPWLRLSPVPVLAGVLLILFLGAFWLSRRDAVVTGVGEQRLLTLEDGTRVFLNTATRVVVRYDRNFRCVELQGGEALFDVAREAGRPFVVRAGGHQVRALGTSFVVRFDDRQTAVTLVEGKVAVSAVSSSKQTAEPMVMASGQRVTFAARKAPKLDMPSLEQAVAWRHGQVMLDDTRLASAVAEMNRYSQTKLIVEEPAAERLLVNGLFQAGDSASFATAVAQTYGLHVTAEHGRIVLHGLPQPVGALDR